MRSETLLTIAGHDPSSGAGVTADLSVFAAHGFFGTSAITALTVQSTTGVRSSQPVSAELLKDTLWTLHRDLRPSGVKIGMLATREIVETVADYVVWLGCPVVLDPVIRSSSGRALLNDDGIETLRTRLLPLVNWVTPNIDELSVLASVEIPSGEAVPAAVEKLRPFMTGGVVATGGHLEPPDDFVRLPGSAPEGSWIGGSRVETRATHGTGCAFSSALLCGLVQGKPAEQAVTDAKEYVRQAMLRAMERGKGKGPMNLLWPLSETKSQ